MHTPLYHNPTHTGIETKGVQAVRPINGHFNSYLPAMDHGYAGWWANWRAKRTAKKAEKWSAREQKWVAKTGGAPAGDVFDPNMYPTTTQAGMGGIKPGAAVGGILALGLVVGAIFLLTAPKKKKK